MDNLIDIIGEDNIGITTLTESKYFNIEQLIDQLKSNKYSFNVLSLNCQSLNAKFDQLRILITRLEAEDINIAVICLQETWLTPTSNLNFYELPGYKFISQDSICSSHSGISIYVQDKYEYSMLPLYNENTIWQGQFLKITNLDGKGVIVGNVYRPPSDLAQSHMVFCENMNNILCNLENQNSEVIICGDFNIDLLKVNIKKTTTDFYDMITSSGFFPKITLPTRITYHSSTLIDNIFCKLSSRLINSRAGIVDTHISDHLPIFICIENLICKEGVRKYVKQINNNVNDQLKFKHALASENILTHLETNLAIDPNNNYAKVEEILTRVKDETMPSKLVRFNKYKHKKSDWITNGILKSIKYKDKLYKNK